MPIELKPHNIETYGKMQDKFKESKRVAVIQPPGTGKSYLALKLLEENKGKKAIYLAPSNPILHNLKKNIFESGMNMRNFPGLKRMTYAKLMGMRDEEIAKLGADIIILDEFHHCGAPEWGNGVNRLLAQNPESSVLGLSATPIRYFDKGRDMAEELFDGNVASEMNLEEAIDRGILPEATYVSALYSYSDQLSQMHQDINKISNPNKRAEAQRLFGELKGKLDENTQRLPELLSQYMINKNGKYIVFCKNIEDMKQKMQAAQELFGGVNSSITTYSVSSENDIKLNDRTLSSFEQADDDTLKLMFAVDMLNEGYHISDLDGVVMMRPTFSPTIFEQQLGRALSVKKDGENSPVILDLVNNFDSCKIIEDFCEKMRQYGKGNGEKDSTTAKSRLSIFDKTKGFREIASRITELCKRTVTIDEKIEIFNRFMETGEELTGKTVFEGYSIGQWGVQIRSELKNKNRSFTKEQLEQLERLGVLDRQFDTTVDEKIEELIDWSAKYPKAKVQFTNCPTDILREYAQSEEDLKKLQEQYERMQRHYEYVRVRNSQGKLTPSQENACKEGNIGGIFGYPSKTEELARKYGISPYKIDYILSKYGTMENYIKAYRENGDKEFEKDGPLRSNIKDNLFIDISSDTQNNGASRLYHALYNNSDNPIGNWNFVFFDSDKVMEGLNTLTEREADVLRYRFGMVDGTTHTLDEAKEIFGVTRERVRQIENKAIRKLRHPHREKHYRKVYDERDSEGKKFTPEEEARRKLLLDRLYSSNIIFTPDEEYSQDGVKIDSIATEELREIALELSSIQRSAIEREQTTLEETPIEEIGLSARTYWCLKRANINTIEQLRGTSKEELMAIRNMGTKSLQEIEEKLKESNSEAIQDTSIDELDFSVRTYNCLKRANINTVGQLRGISKEELMAIRNMSTKSLQEIEEKLKGLEQVAQTEEKLQESIDTDNQIITESEGASSSGETEIEKARAIRDELAREVERLKQQTKSAEQLLASYDKLLGITQNGDKTPDTKGE